MVISHAGVIFGDHRRSIRDDLIEALLIINLQLVPDIQGLFLVLERIACDSAGGTDGGMLLNEHDGPTIHLLFSPETEPFSVEGGSCEV
jgi:hypothetical protein